MGCSSQKNNQLAALKRVGSLRPKKVEGASRQFARCKRCTEVYMQRYQQGYSLDKLTVTD